MALRPVVVGGEERRGIIREHCQAAPTIEDDPQSALPPPVRHLRGASTAAPDATSFNLRVLPYPFDVPLAVRR